MSRVSVDELLVDTDFIDKMTQVKRVPTINSFGENTLSECLVQTVGSIQPATGKALERIPESLRNHDVKSFWMRGTITATSPGKYSDVLVFQNVRYAVQNVMDWTPWGIGWSEGLCIAEPPSE